MQASKNCSPIIQQRLQYFQGCGLPVLVNEVLGSGRFGSVAGLGEVEGTISDLLALAELRFGHSYGGGLRVVFAFFSLNICHVWKSHVARMV